MIEAVVGKARAHRMEISWRLAQCIREVLERADIRVAGGRQTIDPWIENLGLMNVQRFVRTRRPGTRGSEGGSGDHFVTGKVVSGIVSGAKRGDSEFGLKMPWARSSSVDKAALACPRPPWPYFRRASLSIPK